MKKIVNGKVLQDKMREAINLLCDTVKCTLGPKGCNVLIDHTSFNPFITNDGVTIAESIESDDEVINAILEIAKESSIKTNNVVGDGTTTTLVILQCLFNMCLDLINDGVNPMVLKKELDNSLENVLSLLEREKLDVNDDIIYNVARISSNDDDIARVVSDVFSKIPYKEAISVREVDEPVISVDYLSGYSFTSVLASLLLLKDESCLSYENCLVLIIDDVLSDLENISPILNDVFNSNKCLVIVANDFSSVVVNNVVSYVLNGELNCLLVKVNEYGLRQRIVEKDLEIISGAKIVNSEMDVSVHSLGVLKKVFVTKDEIRMDFDYNDSISNYVLNVSNELKNLNDEYLREFYLKRLSMFDSGCAVVSIGAYTKVELREKRMRLDDALSSVYSSSDGVLIGGGITLLKVSNSINSSDKVFKIWKKSLEMPFVQLMSNSGVQYELVKEKLLRENFNLVYNVSNDSFEKIKETYVIDSYKVVVNSIVNACSIAKMLITTSSLIINEKVNNLNKVNEYGDI